MDQPNSQEGPPSAHNPPAYSVKEPYTQQPPPADGAANPAMTAQYQPYYVPYGAAPGQGPVVQFPQHITMVVVHETDYLAYSIFTMLCCCLPLGIAALIFSIQTRDANKVGDKPLAERNSKLARNLAHAALGVGIVLIIVCVTVILV